MATKSRVQLDESMSRVYESTGLDSKSVLWCPLRKSSTSSSPYTVRFGKALRKQVESHLQSLPLSRCVSLSFCWLIVSIALGQLLDKLLALCVGAAGSTCVMRGRPTPRRWFYLYFYVNLLLQILLLPLSSGNTLEMLPPTRRYQLDVITTATTTCNSFFLGLYDRPTNSFTHSLIHSFIHCFFRGSGSC